MVLHNLWDNQQNRAHIILFTFSDSHVGLVELLMASVKDENQINN